MNQRLEKELIKWHKKHFGKNGTFEEYSGFYLENSSQLDLARHFYSLALEDVEKILKKIKVETPVLTSGTLAYPSGRIVGRTEVCKEILDFIDQLSK